MYAFCAPFFTKCRLYVKQSISERQPVDRPIDHLLDRLGVCFGDPDPPTRDPVNPTDALDEPTATRQPALRPEVIGLCTADRYRHGRAERPLLLPYDRPGLVDARGDWLARCPAAAVAPRGGEVHFRQNFHLERFLQRLDRDDMPTCDEPDRISFRHTGASLLSQVFAEPDALKCVAHEQPPVSANGSESSRANA